MRDDAAGTRRKAAARDYLRGRIGRAGRSGSMCHCRIVLSSFEWSVEWQRCRVMLFWILTATAVGVAFVIRTGKFGGAGAQASGGLSNLTCKADPRHVLLGKADFLPDHHVQPLDSRPLHHGQNNAIVRPRKLCPGWNQDWRNHVDCRDKRSAYG